MPPKRQTSRREFLSGRAALQAISDLPARDEALCAGKFAATEAAHEAALPEAGSPGTYLIQVGRDAMACEFQVLLNAGQQAGATESALEALDLVADLEQQMSVFRAESEISRLNQTAHAEAVAVEPRLFQLLQQAVELHQVTGGAFDITTGPLWKAWGFHRRAGVFPTQDEIDQALQRVGTGWVQLDAEACTVRFLRQGLEINLGGIGKGYALDRCAERLRERGVADFLMHGGHSSMLARGSRLHADSQNGWTIALRHPLRQDQRLLEVRLQDRALGTSGSGNQFFHFGGQRYGHVIDPRTGFPADGLLSATVLASSAARADALATALLVMGLEQALEFCAAHQDLGAILVCPGERSGSLAIHTRGLGDDELRRLE